MVHDREDLPMPNSARDACRAPSRFEVVGGKHCLCGMLLSTVGPIPMVDDATCNAARATQRSRNGLDNGFSARLTAFRRDTASGDAMLLDVIATGILAGMMFIPLVNIVVGMIFGAGLGGVVGAGVGLSLAVLIMAGEKFIGDRLGWFDPSCESLNDDDVLPQTRVRLQLTRRRALIMPSNRRGHYPRMPIYFRGPSTLVPWKPRPLALRQFQAGKSHENRAQ
jgi:hypothetical protein